MRKTVILSLLLMVILGSYGCSCAKQEFSSNKNPSIGSSINVSSIKINSSDLEVTGTNLLGVTSVKITQEGVTNDLTINSNDSSLLKLTSNLSNGLKLIPGKVFSLIITNAYGSETVSAVFSLSDGSIDGVKILDHAITTAKLSGPLGGESVGEGQVLKWNNSTKQWTPSTLSSLTYVGSWDASSNTPDIVNSAPSNGSFYIVSNSGTTTVGSYSSWNVGDWVIYNGTSWDKIQSSSGVSSVFGRTGVITAQTGDYTWNQINKTTSSIGDIADVDLTSSPTTNDVLKFNGTKWVPGTITTNISNGSVTNNMLSGSIDQSKVTNLTTDLASKEPLISSGATSQYYRGDKTWQTLNTDNVTEGSNLYFTNARAVSALSSSLSNYATISSLSSYVTTSNLTTSLSSKADLTNSSQNITANAIKGLASPSTGTDATNKDYVDNLISGLSSTYVSISNLATQLANKLSTSGGNLTGDLTLEANLKLKSSNANLVTIKPSATSNTYSLTLPTDKGTANQVLQTDGNGVLSWVNQSSGGGSSLSSTDELTEGSTNLYFTNARAVSALTSTLGNYVQTSSMTSNLANKADLTNATQTISALSMSVTASPSSGYDVTNKTYVDGLLSLKEPTVSSGSTSQYYRGDKTWQTLDTSSVPENGNLYFTNARAVSALTSSLNNKADLTNATQTISALSMSVTASPSSGYDVTNKTYVDGLLSGKESSITAGSTTQYYRGDKTWQTLSTDVLASLIGVSSSATSSTKIATTDSVSNAFLALQKQINYILSATYFPQWSKTAWDASTMTNMYTTTTPNGNAIINMGYDSSKYFMTSGSSGFQVITDSNLTGNNPTIFIDSYDGGTTMVPELAMRRAKGTLVGGARTATQSGDVLGRISASSYTGSAFSTAPSGKIEMTATENQASGARGGSIVMSIIKTATSTLYDAIKVIGDSTNTNNTTVKIAGNANGTYGFSSNDMKASLDINGSAITRTKIYSSGATVDCSLSNSIALKAPGTGSIVLNNIQEGSSFLIALQDTGSTYTPSFTYTKAEDGASTGLTFYYTPSLNTRSSTKKWVGTFTRVDNDVYVNWQEF